ncbi:mediator complex subunit Srb8 [Schizosaccharomyces japonicus yFS275]|uniref:Mediator of RNA polymerase II transcription subunit 12 n=1 Tax=Schizosaccharomyces japonicus (strain yFS275 / FY16936) TaxID=402676 RepID=B6JXL4_SCHJY|nr:mediator complex subunit Srb8 [Schizosaccharomyces japonicus yFS275]EEB05158.1 mediator complex subunit Srb8 [Schizosaccharomyces japonicus yFS275]
MHQSFSNSSIGRNDATFHSNGVSVVESHNAATSSMDVCYYKHEFDAGAFESRKVQQGHFYVAEVADEHTSSSKDIREKITSTQALGNVKQFLAPLLHEKYAEEPNFEYSDFKPPPRVTLQESKRASWFQDLANHLVPLSNLAKRIPHGIWGKDILRSCMSYFVPINRAAWFIKCVGVNEARAFLRKNPNNTVDDWYANWTASVCALLSEIVSSMVDMKQRSLQAKQFSYVLQIITYLIQNDLLNETHMLQHVLRFLYESNASSLPKAILVLEFFWCRIMDKPQIAQIGVILILDFLKILKSSFYGLPAELKSSFDQRLNLLLFRLAYKRPNCYFMPDQWKTIELQLKYAWRRFPGSANVYAVIHERNSRSHRLINPLNKRFRFLEILNSLNPTSDWKLVTSDLLKLLPTDETLHLIIKWCVGINHMYLVEKPYYTAMLFRYADLNIQTLQENILHFLFNFDFSHPNEVTALAVLLDELHQLHLFSFSTYIKLLAAKGYLRDSMRNTEVVNKHCQFLMQYPVHNLRRSIRTAVHNILIRNGVKIHWEAVDQYIQQFRKNPKTFHFADDELYSIVSLTLSRLLELIGDSTMQAYFLFILCWRYSALRVIDRAVPIMRNNGIMRLSLLILLVKGLTLTPILRKFIIEMSTKDEILSEAEKAVLIQLDSLYKLDLNVNYTFVIPLFVVQQNYMYERVQNEPSCLKKFMLRPNIQAEELVEYLTDTLEHTIKDEEIIFTNTCLQCLKVMSNASLISQKIHNLVRKWLFTNPCEDMRLNKLLHIARARLISIEELSILLNELLTADTVGEVGKELCFKIFSYRLSRTDDGSKEWYSYSEILQLVRCSIDMQNIIRKAISGFSHNRMFMLNTLALLYTLDFETSVSLFSSKEELRDIVCTFIPQLCTIDIRESFRLALEKCDLFYTTLYSLWLYTLDERQLSRLSFDFLFDSLAATFPRYRPELWQNMCLGLSFCKDLFQEVILRTLSTFKALPQEFLSDVCSISAWILKHNPDKHFLNQLSQMFPSRMKLVYSWCKTVGNDETKQLELQSWVMLFIHLLLHFHSYLKQPNLIHQLNTFAQIPFIFDNPHIIDILTDAKTFLLQSEKMNDKAEQAKSLAPWEDIEGLTLQGKTPYTLQQFDPKRTTSQLFFWTLKNSSEH